MKKKFKQRKEIKWGKRKSKQKREIKFQREKKNKSLKRIWKKQT